MTCPKQTPRAPRLGNPTVRTLLTDRALPALDAPRRIGVDWLQEGDAHLDMDVAGVHFVKDVCFRVTDYSDVPGRLPMGRVQLVWEPIDHGDVYPAITADLEIEPIDEKRTMISLLASYEPPLGRIGAVVDRVAMHRIAEAALARFFERLTTQDAETSPERWHLSGGVLVRMRVQQVAVPPHHRGRTRRIIIAAYHPSDVRISQMLQQLGAHVRMDTNI